MSRIRIGVAACLLVVACALSAFAQQSGSSSLTVQVPTLVNFSGVLTDVNGKPLSGMVGVTFSLYKDQQGGAPLWIETQNVQPDNSGHYSVMLGLTARQGLPADLFVLGEARWLGVQTQGQAEQSRVMLLSVPYALKAGDAATVGGLPPSAFVLAAPGGATLGSSPSSGVSESGLPPGSSDVTTTGGTVNNIPLWTTSSNIQSSAITQSSSGKTAKIGINNSKPASALDVKGASTLRGLLSLPATGTATANAGFNSQPIQVSASAYNSGMGAAVSQNFQWQAEPAGNDTSNASGTLNLLFGQGAHKLAETGLNIASNGQINFASGQTFPGTGTVTSVGSGAGLSGGPITGSGTLSIANGGVTNAMLANPSLTVNAGTALTGGGSVTLGGSTTLNVDTTKVPLLAANNIFTGNQTVKGNLSATGMVTGSAFQIGSNLFDYGSYSSENAFLGFAGNTTISGTYNTASGYTALFSDTTGGANAGYGAQALYYNTTGGENSAIGVASLFSNTSGTQNTANGYLALSLNTTGGDNTGIGYEALQLATTGFSDTAVGAVAGVPADGTLLTGSSNTSLGSNADPSTGSLNNATAIGANAEVAQSNALILGSINGVNNASADTSVGIGTTTPVYSGLSDHSTTELNIVGNHTYVPLVVQSPSGFGTWMLLNNTSTGGAEWAILSAGSGNGEGAGNLAITNLTGQSTIFLEGNVQVTGNLSKGGGSFKIDHPLDPANKYLYHSFVESPDMMDIYNGVVSLDARGSAWVTMPNYFEALNRDFRYQLTSIGRPQPSLYIAREMSGNRFKIAGGKLGGRVSWQVTGIRQDAYANAHRINVEEDKSPQEQGRYLHPELFGAPAEKAIGYRVPALSAEQRRIGWR